MRIQPLYKQTLRLIRGGLIAAAGLAFFVAAVGVPLPAGRTKDRSVAFPCMDRTCGCHDAAGCKAHCCCFSDEEKLAWAADHDVDPAPFVDDRALARLATAKVPRASRDFGDGAGCHSESVASCCAKTGATRQNSASRRQRAGSESDGLLTIAAYRQCTGLAPLWTLFNAALAPPQPVRYEFEWVVSGQVAPQSPALTAVSFSPPTPPPRS